MNRLSFSYRVLVIIILAFGLIGCIVPRSEGITGDIQSFVPPITGAVVRIQPAAQEFDVGSTTVFEIRVENVTDLVGVDLELQFDPAILQVQDVDSVKGGTQIQPGDFLAADYVQTNEADNNVGVIRYVLLQTGGSPANGGGVLALVTFRGFSPGSSALTFSMVKLSASDAQAIAATSEPGQATVTQPGGEPTATSPLSTPVAGEPTATATSPTDTPVPSDTPAPTDTPVPAEPTATPIPAEPTVTPTQPTATLPPPVETPTVTVTPINIPPPGATFGYCYRVKSNDTFYSLTHEFNVSAYALNLVNDLWPRNYVFTNQAIFVPTQLGHGPNFYIVEAGDTLPGIADHCHLPVSFVAQVNDLDLNAVVDPGQILEIPIPPFPPPSRFNYSTRPVPFGPCSVLRYEGCDTYLPYRPGPPLDR